MTVKRRSGEETRAAILAATRRMFAEKGFDRATIRAIAAEAGCDPALVMRYFGSKRKLFFEAVDSPFESFPDAPTGSAGQLPEIAANLLEHWHRDKTFFGLLRAAASDEEAAALMREFFELRVRDHQPRVTGLPPDQAVCFGAMVVGVAFGREITRLPPLADMTSEDLGAMIGKVFCACNPPQED
ncbi:TetR/AcrR family transcriptional regulator [Altererythrobacter sp. FM1]|uniref:TetR/AcrR family transcriptional regulator n=1 Tax=Tsuneonella flava TaxID=2055955 RepID=UPI000C80131C|nr:TetR family transcriptional regulator [Tsuneonella flava]ROT97020.1 TetR/AcrR family transcriptional regulator [Altererythrobacter sp. FM1]